jgi:hypothetical protein
MDLKRFEPIIVELPRKQILSRLGYVRNKTQISKIQQNQLDDLIEQAREMIALKAHAVEIGFDAVEKSRIRLDGGIFFQSHSLAELLVDSKQVLLMGATAGRQIVEQIDEFSCGENQDMAKAVVFDAVASEMTDAALDWLVNFYNNSLRRQNKILTKTRFSAGYGDFDVSNQKFFYDLLKLNELDIELTENYLLVPEKSVTAVAGIEPIQD